MPLFEVAVLERAERPKKSEEPKLEKLLFGPEPIIGHNEQAVGYQVLLENSERFKGKDYKNLVVIVRPFG